MLRRWRVQAKGINTGYEISNITLSKLKTTIKTLKTKGGAHAQNKWASPIVPLLIEHVFIESRTNVKDIANISIELTEGRELKLC